MPEYVSPVVIMLTEKQMREIEPIMALVSEAYKSGKKGMAIAQVFNDFMMVGFVPNKTATKIQKILPPREKVKCSGASS